MIRSPSKLKPSHDLAVQCPFFRWDDVDPPWDPLDDEGEEDEIYDAEMHGDFGVFNDGYPDNDDDL